MQANDSGKNIIGFSTFTGERNSPPGFATNAQVLEWLAALDITPIERLNDLLGLLNYVWPTEEIEGDFYTIGRFDRTKLLRVQGAQVTTVNVDGILPGQFLIIEQGGWGRVILEGGDSSLSHEAGKELWLKGKNARVVLSSEVAGIIIVDGDLADEDPIRQAIEESNIVLDLDADWGLVDRPAYNVNQIEAWYSKNGDGIHSVAAFPRENQLYLRRNTANVDLDLTLQTGIPSAQVFNTGFIGLPDIPQPFSILIVVSHLEAGVNAMVGDGVSPELVKRIYYSGYSIAAGAGFDGGGELVPHYAYNADYSAAPASVLGRFDGATSAIYCDDLAKATGDAGDNALQGSTFIIDGNARTLLKRLIVFSGTPDMDTIMAMVIVKYGIPSRL